MSCPDYVNSPAGRQGIGVIQPQSGLDYPLVGPSVFNTRDYARNIRYLLADFYFEYDDPAEYNGGTKTVHPLRIKYLYGVGCIENTPTLDFPTPVHDADIVLVDANNTVVFDTTAQPTEFFASNWGVDYKIYTWKQASTVCRLVAYTTWVNGDNERQQFHKYLFPPDAVLDERAVYKMPRRLLSVAVRNGGITTAKRAGSFVFVNGYNTDLSVADTVVNNFRADTSVTFTAVAGSGLGRYTDCTESTGSKPITKLNGVGPDSFGNFLLASNDCLWARRPTTYTGDNPTPWTTEQLQLGADCGPCCSCDDYANTAEYMNTTGLRYQLIGQRVQDVRLYHDNNIVRWDEQRTCSLLQPLKLMFVPQNCPYIDVIAMLCNPCDTCIGETSLKLVISTEQPGLITSLECGYTALYATGINGGAIGVAELVDEVGYTFALPQILPNDSAYVKLRLKFTEPNPDPDPDLDPEEVGKPVKARGAYAISGALTAIVNSTQLPLIPGCGTPEITEPALAVDTKTLYCTDTGTTEAPC
jgi:hypothetical protein